MAGDRELRVLHVVTAATFSGIERHVMHLSRALMDMGCAAELACPPSAVRLRAEAHAAGIPVRPPASCAERMWLAAVARRMSASAFDVVHVHDGRAAVLGVVLAPLARAGLVRTQHFLRPASTERSGWRRGSSLAVHRLVNHRLAGYVAISQAVAEAARLRQETAGAELVVIAPAIMLPDAVAVESARVRRSELPSPVVVFAGRLVRERRLDVLLRAIPLVRAELPDCRFVIAGIGEDEAELRQLSAELGVEPAITWTGWVDDAYALLSGAHVYVNTWSQEGFGMAMAEAMALTLPVVAVEAGANGELVQDRVTGRLVAPDDPGALAAALVELLADRAVAEHWGNAARRSVLARFGAPRTAEATLALYRRVHAGASR